MKIFNLKKKAKKEHVKEEQLIKKSFEETTEEKPVDPKDQLDSQLRDIIESAGLTWPDMDNYALDTILGIEAFAYLTEVRGMAFGTVQQSSLGKYFLEYMKHKKPDDDGGSGDGGGSGDDDVAIGERKRPKRSYDFER